MSLRAAVAAPFRQHGHDRLAESKFVVALSLDRDWFSADQAKRLVDVATGEGLLDREDDDLIATFDVGSVDIPDDFDPNERMLQERSAFEQALDAITSAGADKQSAVAGINELQQELGVTVEAAAVVYARRQGINVEDAAAKTMEELKDEA
ncbi:MAG: hypothetical protein ACI9PP_002235 [Halobacteriales archaeon]|jgi:hypothetical protein